LSSVGIFIAIWYITPPNLKATDVYVPFGVILGATVVYALVWTLLIKRQPGFTPARVEDVMEREFVRHGN